jgi:tetratricopeptide (TPR) repeat protein
VGFNGEGGLDPDIARLNLKYTQKSPNIVLTSPLTFYRLVVSDDLVPLFGEGPVHTDDNPRLEFSAPRVMHVFNMEKVYDRVMKNGRLSGTMAALKDSAANSVSEQIDYAAFALSFERPSPGMVDLGRATEQERDHYRALLAWYCSSHYVNDFRFIGDSELEQVSIRAQLSFMKERVKDLVRPVPIYEHIANLHMALEEYGEAAGWYLRALEVAPDNGTAHYNIGRALTATGDFAEAEHHYRESIRIDPYHTLSYNNLANLLARQGALGEAVPLYREALMVDSTLAVAHRNLGIVLRELGRKEESDFHLEEADRLEGNAE